MTALFPIRQVRAHKDLSDAISSVKKSLEEVSKTQKQQGGGGIGIFGLAVCVQALVGGAFLFWRASDRKRGHLL